MVCCLFLTIGNLQAQEILKDDSAWFTFTNKTMLSSKVYLGNVLQMRRVHFAKSTQVFIAGTSVNYSLPKNWTVGFGYLLFKSYPNGVCHASILKNENRLWQQITQSTVVGKANLSNRFIFEQRFKDIVNSAVTPNIIEGTAYEQRFRYKVSLALKLFKLSNTHYLLGKISNEVRVRFKTGLSQPDFDQNNLYAYLGCQFLKNAKVWVGYGRDYYKVNANKFVQNNIAHFAMSYDIDLRKKQ